MLTLFSLGAGGIDWAIRERLALPQTRSDLDAMDSARLLVLIPSGSRNVATNDSFDGQNSEFAHLHASVLKHWAEGGRNLRGKVEGDEMRAQRGDRIAQDLEPCLCAQCEENSLVRDTLQIHMLASPSLKCNWSLVGVGPYILHDHIVCGDAISRNEEESLVVHLVEITDFSTGDQGQRTLEICVCKCVRHDYNDCNDNLGM